MATVLWLMLLSLPIVIVVDETLYRAWGSQYEQGQVNILLGAHSMNLESLIAAGLLFSVILAFGLIIAVNPDHCPRCGY
jgi:hypothetical protein